MLSRASIEEWIRAHRPLLSALWAAVGLAVLVWFAVWGPDYYLVRGRAPWPRGWMMLFFLSLWSWVGLRFIALWIWAWVVMAAAPVCLFVPLRGSLDAWWLSPLLTTLVGLSAITVVLVVGRELRRRRLPDT